MLYNCSHILLHYNFNNFSICKLNPSTYKSGKPHQETATIVYQISVALIVSAGACIQSVQGSNLTDDWKVKRRLTVFFFVEFNFAILGVN